MSVFGSASSPELTSTVEEFIALGDKNVITYHNLSFRENIDENRNFPTWNILSDFTEEIDALSSEVELTDEEYRKYIYNPKLLAYDLYKSTELFFVILAANHICSAKEFNSKTIKLLKVDDLNNLMSMIYNSNKQDIEIYNEKQTSTEDYW